MADRAQVEAHLPMVRKLAGEVARSLGGRIETGDLIAYGTQGLIEALERFDPQRGFAFSTFAYYRIRGAMYDGVRKLGWRTRRRAPFEEAANHALQQVHEESGGASDAQALERGIDALAGAYLITLDDERTERQPDPGPDAETEVSRASEALHVREALRTLPEKERRLLEQMYYEDKSLTDAGAGIGLSKSWACRLHARALKLLAEALAARGVEPAQP